MIFRKLSQILEIKNELLTFFFQNEANDIFISFILTDNIRCNKMPYLADIFNYLNRNS